MYLKMLIKKQLQTIMQHTASKTLQQLNMKEKLIFIFTIAVSGIVILFGVLHYQMTARTLYREAREESVQMIDYACSDINTLFTETYLLCSAVNDDISLQRLMRRTFTSKKELFSSDLEGNMEMLTLPSHNSYNKDIFGIYVLGDHGGRYKSCSSSFLSADPRKTDWYRIIHSTGRPQWFPPHKNSYVVQTPEFSCISIGIPFVDKLTGHIKGVILAEIASEKLSEIADRAGNSGGAVFLMDERNRIMNLSALTKDLSSKDQTSIEQARKMVEQNLKEVPEYGVSHILEDKNRLVVYQTLEQADWKIVGVIPRSEIIRSVRYIKILTIMLIAISVSVSMAVAELVAESVTKPLSVLADAMEQVRAGNLDVSVHTERKDEIGVLYQSFQHMTREMRTMIQTIYEEQEKLRIEELRALQAQIQPHFLYNTLDSIIWSLRMNQVKESIQMLDALTDFFKITLSKGKDIISMEEEIRHVNSYLRILHKRYCEKFDYDLNVEPAVLKTKTPKLIIQPIVENAIYHGLKPAEGKGYLYIHVFEQDGNTCVRIEDTGVGISPEQVKQINQELETISSDQSGTGYGIRNVNDKLKIVFGSQSGVTIQSSKGEGTIVTLLLHRQGGITNESDYL